MKGHHDPAEVGARIEALLAELRGASDEVAARAETLVSLLVRMYGDGLTRMVEGLDDDTTRRLATDPAVAALLVLHDLHPVGVEERIGEALDRVRPYLGSHAGGVEFLGVGDDGVARLRLQGSCDGCPSSAVTVQMAIEGAILEVAPEVVAVEVEGVVSEPAQTLVSLGPIRRRPRSWVVVERPPPPGVAAAVSVAGLDLMVAAVNGDLYAYAEICPGCGAAISDGSLAGPILTCARCSTGFDLTAAGRSLDGESMLDPIPLLTEDGVTRVSVPEAAA